MKSELWRVRVHVTGVIDGARHDDVHRVDVQIDPPFGIRCADAEVAALRAIAEAFPSCDARAVSSTFVEEAGVS